MANQDGRIPAVGRKPSAWKADGRWLETKEAGRFAQPSLVYVCVGAGNGTRTRDPLLGKQMLYQLSYSRSFRTWLQPLTDFRLTNSA